MFLKIRRNATNLNLLKKRYAKAEIRYADASDALERKEYEVIAHEKNGGAGFPWGAILSLDEMEAAYRRGQEREA